MQSIFSDPHIKVAGLPDSVRQAKEKVMAVLDTKVECFLVIALFSFNL